MSFGAIGRRSPPRHLLWLPPLLVLVVWLPSLGASFQFDDWSVIVRDARVQSLAAWWHSLPGIRPVLKLSYALNHTAGDTPAGFRAVNILLHAFNAALVFALLRRLARRLRIADDAGAVFIAAVATLLFALHPVQTESVTYVSGRSNVLMASFALLALLAFTQERRDERPWHAQPLALAGLVAALATKETAAVLPLAMLLVTCRERGRGLGASLLGVTPALITVLLLLAVGVAYLPYDHLLSVSLGTRAPLANLATQIHGVGWLVGQLLRGDLLNADPALPAVAGLTPASVFTGAALGSVLLLGLWSLRARPELAFGILWFYLWLAPTNSLLARLDVANDRQLYLAIIGPAWLVGLALLRMRSWLQEVSGSLPYVLIAVLGVTLAAGTLTRNRVYATEVSFWQDVLAKSPRNARAANNLGMAHALACEPLAARAAFQRASELAPEGYQPQVNLALLERGELAGQSPAPACRLTPQGP